MMFLLTVDQGQSFSFTGTPLSKESEVSKLIASHKTIATACVDLFLPCSYLEHKSSQLTVSLGFFHIKKIDAGHSPTLEQGSLRSFNDKRRITSMMCTFKMAGWVMGTMIIEEKLNWPSGE